jgi:uncharacterized protein YjbI with pentapeptide repeats
MIAVASAGGTRFRDTDLRGANFEGARLRGSDFRGASLAGARFAGATGVRLCRFDGPPPEDTK